MSTSVGAKIFLEGVRMKSSHSREGMAYCILKNNNNNTNDMIDIGNASCPLSPLLNREKWISLILEVGHGRGFEEEDELSQ